MRFCGIVYLIIWGIFITAKCGLAQQSGFRDLDFPQKRISLDLKDMDIIEALKYIATKAQMDIIPTKEVSGRVSLTVQDVPVKDVFEIILRSNNLVYEKRGSIYNVMTENEYKNRFGRSFYDNRIFKVIQLQYASPEQALTLLNSMKSDVGKVLIDPDSGIILILDTPERVANMEATLRAMDQKSIIRVFNLKYARAKDMEEKLKTQLDLKKVGSVKADERTNQLIVQTLPQRMEEIAKLIESLDQKTRQILIDAKIIQVQLNDATSSAVEWEGLFQLSKKHGMTYLGSYPFSSVQASTDSWRSRKDTLTEVGYVGSFPFSGTTSNYSAGRQSVGIQEMHLGVIGKNDFDVIIKYLQSLGQTRILSNPKLAVVNNQEARIHVGERQAYITTTTTQTQTSTTVSEAVTYVDVGIQLAVTPTINEDGFVTVKIKPEISSVVSYLETSSNNKIPIIDTSTAETIVMVKDGTSILIGGLSKQEKVNTSEGVPLLQKVPVLGKIFSNKVDKTKRSELMVLLTPHVVEGDELVTGSQSDFGYKLDKEYQKYPEFLDEPVELEPKPYQTYPPLRGEQSLPTLKPERSF
ncbi:MAG: secretin and TonB N-terminal domain-containing protein [Candidatus Omnitrophica bacterium]|nr:secretin and TonB N-terminal domain-containing protein [Candidatus Omnitrophota bacterium]